MHVLLRIFNLKYEPRTTDGPNNDDSRICWPRVVSKMHAAVKVNKRLLLCYTSSLSLLERGS